MKKKVILGIVTAVVLTGGLTLYFSKSVTVKALLNAGPSPAAKSQTPAGQKANADPAAAGQTQAEEAKGQEEEEAPTVEIPVEKQQMIGVKTVVAAVSPLRKTIRTVGTIGYDEKRIATVNTKFEGWIEKLHLDYTGMYVRKGQPLAEIYSPELLATQQELLNLIKWTKQNREIKDERMSRMLSKDAESIVEAARQRLRLWDITDAQIKRIEDTGNPIRTLTIYSPVNGYAVQKSALQGMRVMPGEKLFDIADLSTVWVLADIYESDLAMIRDGQKAVIGMSYFPGREFASRIDFVYPAISGETRTAKVRFTIPNPGNRLKPQMYTNVEIKIDLGSKLAVPRDAVIDTGVRQIVYVDKGEGNFEPREVTTGVRSDDMVEIIRGLKAGEKVASAANFLIDSEAQLRGVKPLPQPKPQK